MPPKIIRRVLGRAQGPAYPASGAPRKGPGRALLAAGLMAVSASPTIAKGKARAAHGPGHGQSHAHATRTHGHGHGSPARASLHPAVSSRSDGGTRLRTQFATDPATARLADRLTALAPQASARVVSMALAARTCAMKRGLADGMGTRLGVIDYSKPSTVTRLWVFDTANVERPRLMFSEVVAHGRGSGEILPVSFSNRDGSFQSSLGLYRTAETYEGHNGYSLRLDGLEPGYNDQARNRDIVVHGAWYAEPDMIARQGRLGRSQGCPAVRPAVAHPLIDAMAGGQTLFVYSPDPDWLAHSALVNCDGPDVDTQPAPVRTLASHIPQPATGPLPGFLPVSGGRHRAGRPVVLAEAVRPPEMRARSGRRNG